MMASVSRALTAARCWATTPVSSVGVMMAVLSVGLAGGVTDQASGLPHGEDQEQGPRWYLPRGRYQTEVMAGSLPIGDFSRATHMSIKALRYYHSVGLLEPADVDRF